MSLTKITVFGDIMLEAPLFQQLKGREPSDFEKPFAPLRPLLESSDLVVGNLETPLAGGAVGYVEDCFSFNAPDAFAHALRQLGFGFFTTANNHCLDRGYAGLCRTLDVLDSLGIPHTGTYRDQSSSDRIGCCRAGDLTLAVVAYTYGTNFTNNGVSLAGREHCVNLLMPQAAPSRIRPLAHREGDVNFAEAAAFVEGIAGRPLTMTEKQRFKRILRLPTMTIDDLIHPEVLEPYLQRMEADICKAKQQADLVLALPHTGGQFNPLPGSYSLYVADRAIRAGADAVLCAHSHTIQPGVMRGNIPCFYSLGNVSMYPIGDYLDMSCLPEYGMAVHLYVHHHKIARITFSLFKMVIQDDTMAIVPVDTLLERTDDRKGLLRDVNSLYKRITGKEIGPVEREFMFFQEER